MSGPLSEYQNAQLCLRYLELCAKSGSTDWTEEISSELNKALPGLDVRELTRVAKAAEKLGEYSLAARALWFVASKEVLDFGSALHLVRMANQAGRPDLLDLIACAILDKVPLSQRLRLAIEVKFLREGPEAALTAARAGPTSSRSVVDAALLARLLITGGKARLASRYLRLCNRRWPNSYQIRSLLIASLINCGQPHDAQKLLESWGSPSRGALFIDYWFRILLEKGDLEKALAFVRCYPDAIKQKVDPQQILQLFIALGLLEEAEGMTVEAAIRMGRGRKSLAHFQSTHLGENLSELKLYERTQGKLQYHQGSDSEIPEPESVFLFPARERVAQWMLRARNTGKEDRDSSKSIPRRVVQYWNTAEAPPEIEATTLSWEHHADYEYVRFDHRSAVDFLRERYGVGHARAFRLARHVAEASDFFRLCALHADGGIYADADDKLIDHPDRILELGAGMILFREPFGAIANNLMCARPGHPVLETAIELAKTALLARDNDSVWSKTGPGLLTRAVAVYLRRVPFEQSRKDLSILPMYLLRRHVSPHLRMPYKATTAYWNTQDGATPKPILECLTRISEQSTYSYPTDRSPVA